MPEHTNRRAFFALGVSVVSATMLGTKPAQAAAPTQAVMAAQDRYAAALDTAYRKIIGALVESGAKSSKRKVWKEMLARTAQEEEAFGAAVYENVPGLKTEYKRNNRRGAIKLMQKAAKKFYQL